jgi:Flp pilus assembly protein TadD
VGRRTGLIRSRRTLVLWALIAIIVTAVALRGLSRHRLHVASERAATTMMTAFYSAKDGPAALAALDRALGADPRNADLYNLRGSTYEDLGRFPEAERDFIRATRFDPNNAAAWHNLIALEDWRGTVDRAAVATAYQERVVAANSHSALYHRNLARLLDAAGKRDEAEREFRAAVDLAPADGSYYLEFSDYLQQSGTRGRVKAIALLQEAVARNASDRSRLMAAIGRLAFTSQDYQLAAKAYREASTLSPHIPEYREMADEAHRRSMHH